MYIAAASIAVHAAPLIGERAATRGWGATESGDERAGANFDRLKRVR